MNTCKGKKIYAFYICYCTVFTCMNLLYFFLKYETKNIFLLMTVFGLNLQAQIKFARTYDNEAFLK